MGFFGSAGCGSPEGSARILGQGRGEEKAIPALDPKSLIDELNALGLLEEAEGEAVPLGGTLVRRDGFDGEHSSQLPSIKGLITALNANGCSGGDPCSH